MVESRYIADPSSLFSVEKDVRSLALSRCLSARSRWRSKRSTSITRCIFKPTGEPWQYNNVPMRQFAPASELPEADPTPAYRSNTAETERGRNDTCIHTSSKNGKNIDQTEMVSGRYQVYNIIRAMLHSSCVRSYTDDAWYQYSTWLLLLSIFIVVVRYLAQQYCSFDIISYISYIINMSYNG